MENLTIFYISYKSHKYRILPFGLYNKPISFQKFINDTLFNCLNDFCTVYMNNILIYLKDPLEYELYIKEILHQLRKAGL